MACARAIQAGLAQYFGSGYGGLFAKSSQDRPQPLLCNGTGASRFERVSAMFPQARRGQHNNLDKSGGTLPVLQPDARMSARRFFSLTSSANVSSQDSIARHIFLIDKTTHGMTPSTRITIGTFLGASRDAVVR